VKRTVPAGSLIRDVTPAHAHNSTMSKTNYWDQIEQAFEDVDIYETNDVFKPAIRFPI